jgi:hypothetical protein
MVLPSSGPISLASVQTEFGGSNPIGINEYYGVASGVPASGTISLANFYGTSFQYQWPVSSFDYVYAYSGSVASDYAYPPGGRIITLNYSWNCVNATSNYIRAALVYGYDENEVWTTGYQYAGSSGSGSFTFTAVSDFYYFYVVSANYAINAPNYFTVSRPGTGTQVYYAQIGVFD